MMTYISEELYQKLPAWEGKAESVSIASYPQGDQRFIFEGTEQFDSVFDIVTDIRKILGTITLPPKSNPPVYVSVAPGDTRASSEDLVRTFGEFIGNLSKTGDVKVLEEGTQAPKGCITVLSSRVFTLHVEVIKFIKVEDEIKKIEKSVTEKEKAIAPLKKKIEAEDYETKVPEEVRNKEKEKLALYQAELATLKTNIDTYKNLI